MRILAADTRALRDETAFSSLLPLVPEYRQRKALRMRRTEDRALSLGAGLLLICAGIRSESADECGRPYALDRPDLYLSLSHSGSYALCALCDLPIGCDLEQKGHVSLGIMERFFHPNEAAFARAFPETAPDRLWVLKEAFSKCLGTGLTGGLLRNSEIILTGDRPLIRYGDEGNAYCFLEYDEPEGCRCAVCVRGERGRPDIEYINLNGAFL